jgi:hypothetical protein
MSDTTDRRTDSDSDSNSGGSTALGIPVSPTGPGDARPGNIVEAYSFACMSCGFGWEQSYEIEHHVDTSGRAYVTYLADGTKVPSPLTHPTCGNCDGHQVRIMRSGQVADFAARWPAPRGERGLHRTHRLSLHFLRHRRHGGHGGHGEHGEAHSG